MNYRNDVIKEIIELYTVRQEVGIFHPDLNNFMLLLEDIIDARETIEQLSIIPHYVNMKHRVDVVLNDYAFDLSCRITVHTDDLDRRVQRRGEDSIKWPPADDKGNPWEILTPLCLQGDAAQFGYLLRRYQRYLIDTLLPFLFEQVFNQSGLEEIDVPYGFFCFEIQRC